MMRKSFRKDGVPIGKWNVMGRVTSWKKKMMQTLSRYGGVPIGKKHVKGGVTMEKRK